jgi:flagellar biosynthesis protein FlhF
MRIKRFRARDIKTALNMVKEEMGSEAVILSTRQIKDAQDATVEITAGVGYNPQSGGALSDSDAPVSALPVANKDGSRSVEASPSFQGLQNGLSEVKELLLDLTHRTELSERFRHQKDLLRLYRRLVETELDPAIARALVERIGGKNGRQADPEDALLKQLTRLLDHDGKTGRTVLDRQYHALVGPSGVGKTTTLAKLAAFWSMRGGKKVAMISLDSYRLGAAEQLKTYARIMGLPVSVVRDREEFLQAVELYENLDHVLVDTSGRCFTRSETMKELADVFQLVKNLEVSLVLAATCKDRDIAACIKKTQPLRVENLIISKIDETDSYGNVINNLIKLKKPVSFLTNGQKVPDDLIPATPVRLAELITSDHHGD